MNTTTIEDALIFAAKSHKGQLDKGGHPYILHPIRVALKLPREIENWESAVQVALLHDVIEDCAVEPEDLLAEGFPEHIVQAVMFLSRPAAGTPNRPTYREYIRTIRDHGGQIAINVKKADLLDNMSPERIYDLPEAEKDIINRYRQAFVTLSTEQE